MRPLPVADQARDRRDGDRALREQQLCSRRHPPVDQILAEAEATELRVRALDLARGARQRCGDDGQRELAAVVAGDEDPREQVKAAARCERLRAHPPRSDERSATGRQS
jgi:hypothetical protein